MRANSLGTLPGETSAVRAGEESAEAVVARKRLKGGGAKGRRTTKQAILTISVRRHAGLRNAPNFATAATIRAVAETRAGGFRSDARPRVPSRSTGEGGSQKVLNEEVMGQVLDPVNVSRAYEQVKRNDGAPDVDGMSVEVYADHWPAIAAKLREGTYRPEAVSGVNIPKSQGGQRLLGYPTSRIG